MLNLVGGNDSWEETVNTVFILDEMSKLSSPLWSRGSWGGGPTSYSDVVQHHLGEGEWKKTTSVAFMSRPRSSLAGAASSHGCDLSETKHTALVLSEHRCPCVAARCFCE